MLPKDEWVNKFWFIYTIDYYSLIKKNKISLIVEKGMGPKNTVLYKSQT